jgi:hypothetical protein
MTRLVTSHDKVFNGSFNKHLERPNPSITRNCKITFMFRVFIRFRPPVRSRKKLCPGLKNNPLDLGIRGLRGRTECNIYPRWEDSALKFPIPPPTRLLLPCILFLPRRRLPPSFSPASTTPCRLRVPRTLLGP